MKGSFSHAKTHKLYPFLPLHNASHSWVPCQSLNPCNVTVPWTRLSFKLSHAWPYNHGSCFLKKRRDNNGGIVVGCASWGSVAELEKELEAEMKTQEGEEKEGGGMGRFRHKCGERKGVVELLECMEKEAIMGEDVGKEPTDYNRRAQIFDRSSRVFQALKQLNDDVLSQQSST
ncbi:hypothetical protein L6164_029833 [Bauhinia variegata]|uniref:Uncharacterized protein n=1 Tax=Bauhinia variegata TaxID=167791 RepID=A0ACB9LBT0_BAUVA|nr:hypothetical protein L6164_029833 [Bauhinia variegata]